MLKMKLPTTLLQKWRELNCAIGIMECATPVQMTEAYARLIAAKESFEAELNKTAMARMSEESVQQTK